MRSGWLFLILTPLLAAEAEIGLKARRIAHVLVVDRVFLNGSGSFRMMIDTGHASSSISPRAAERLRLRPVFTVDQVTATGTRRVPAAILEEVRAGAAVNQAVEVMISSVLLPGIDGVLGQSWLVHRDYQLDYANNRLVLNAAPPREGIRMALRSVDGRPAISGLVDGRRTDLVLDSGTPAVVVFEPSMRVRPVSLHAGSAFVETGTAGITLGGRDFRMDSVRVPSGDAMVPLLPLSAFRTVYVSNRDGIVALAQ